ncbi:MAG: Ig-like domain-containing protein, partial [Euryarchaeota archaeon]|nr:Ig-like domain-containing protein [Euryarchaeota archaeon]
MNITIYPCGDEVMGAEYKLYFNNILLKALSQDKGSFLSQDSASTTNIVNKIDNPAGRIEYGEMRTGVTNGVTTSGTLTAIKFEVRSSGSGELRLYDVVLSDNSYDPQEIPGVNINNATVELAHPPTPFLICGHVSHGDGSECNNPAVNITNLNTSEGWEARTSADSNYYQIVRANGADLNESEKLQFNVTNGTVSSVANHTIIASEVDDGGLFNFNLTLGTPALNVVINEFVSKSNPEWIELYNPTGSDVSLDGWTIEDGAGNSLASLSGETLPVNGYLVFDFSNKLNDGGDIIYLNTSTTTVDKVAYGDWDDGNVDDNAPKPEDDESAGRYPNGADTNNDGADFILFDTPTHGTENVVAADTAPPIVIDHAPTGTGAPVSTNITATFNESMNPDTLNDETVTVEHNGTAVNGNSTYDALSKTVTFDPADDLNYSETYNATITTGVQDIAGNNMSSNITWNFTTSSTDTIIGIGNVSGNMTVPIIIENAANVGSAHINITYNASVCMITDVTNGTFDWTFA